MTPTATGPLKLYTTETKPNPNPNTDPNPNPKPTNLTKPSFLTMYGVTDLGRVTLSVVPIHIEYALPVRIK